MSLTPQQNEFAQKWARYPDNPLKAARELRGEDGRLLNIGDALLISDQWTREPAIIDAKERCMSMGLASDALPTKQQFNTLLWAKLKTPMSNDEFTRMAKLFADLNQFTDKTQKIEIESVSMNNDQLQEKIDELLAKRATRTI